MIVHVFDCIFLCGKSCKREHISFQINKNEYWEWKGFEWQRDKPLNKQTIAKPWPQEGHSHAEESN
jgi:hypothetical protein